MGQDNVLVSPFGEPLLADFGLLHLLTFSDTFTKTTGGVKSTVRWTAVELFGLDSELQVFTKEADVWAFGMLIYVLFMPMIFTYHTY